MVKKILIGGLVGLMSMSNLALPACQDYQELEKRIQKAECKTYFSSYAKEKLNYWIIEEWHKELFKDYIEKCKDTWWFSGSIKKNGREKFEEQYIQGHMLCLKLAKEKVQEARKKLKKEVKISKQEYLSVVEEICNIENNISCGYVDYTDHEFKKEQKEFVEVFTAHFIKLLFVDEKCKNYTELTKKAYKTKKNYEEYIDRQNEVNEEGLEALRNTMNILTKKLGGNKDIDFLKLNARELYYRTIKEIFGDSAKSNSSNLKSIDEF